MPIGVVPSRSLPLLIIHRMDGIIASPSLTLLTRQGSRTVFLGFIHVNITRHLFRIFHSSYRTGRDFQFFGVFCFLLNRNPVVKRPCFTFRLHS